MVVKVQNLLWDERTCCGQFRKAVIGAYEVQETPKGYVILRYGNDGLLDLSFGENGVMRRLSAAQVEAVLADG